MLEDLDFERVAGGLGIIGPDVGLLEVDPVERLGRVAVTAVSQQFRLAEGAADALDHARLAARIKRRAVVSVLVAIGDAHAVADATSSEK